MLLRAAAVSACLWNWRDVPSAPAYATGRYSATSRVGAFAAACCRGAEVGSASAITSRFTDQSRTHRAPGSWR